MPANRINAWNWHLPNTNPRVISSTKEKRNKSRSTLEVENDLFHGFKMVPALCLEFLMWCLRKITTTTTPKLAFVKDIPPSASSILYFIRVSSVQKLKWCGLEVDLTKKNHNRWQTGIKWNSSEATFLKSCTNSDFIAPLSWLFIFDSRMSRPVWFVTF